jgi:hypothetical protein
VSGVFYEIAIQAIHLPQFFVCAMLGDVPLLYHIDLVALGDGV